MDDVRKPRQRHRQRTGLLDPSHFQAGWEGRFFWRCIRNEMTDHYIELENKGTNRDELEEITIGSLSKAVYEGDTVHGSMMSGQIAGLVKEIRPCKEILDTIVADAQKVLQNTEIKL